MHNIIYFKENRFWIPLTNPQMKTCTCVNWNYLNCHLFSCKRGFNAEQKVTMPMHLTDKGRQWEAETKEPEGEVGSTFILKPRRLLLSIIQILSIQHSQLPFIECQAYFRSFFFSKWSWLRAGKKADPAEEKYRGDGSHYRQAFQQPQGGILTKILCKWIYFHRYYRRRK